MTILAPTNLPATMPAGASQFYARNMSTFVLNFLKDGQMPYDMADEITAATLITKDGEVVSEATKKLLEPIPAMSQELLERAGHLRAGHTGWLRGHQQGAGDAAHATDERAPTRSTASSWWGDAHRRFRRQPAFYALAFIAMVFGAANVVGGYVVTDRMLQMFRKRETPAAKPADEAK